MAVSSCMFLLLVVLCVAVSYSNVCCMCLHTVSGQHILDSFATTFITAQIVFQFLCVGCRFISLMAAVSE